MPKLNASRNEVTFSMLILTFRTVHKHFIEIRFLCNWLDKDSHFTRNNHVVIMKQRNYTRAERKNNSIRASSNE